MGTKPRGLARALVVTRGRSTIRWRSTTASGLRRRDPGAEPLLA